MSASPPGKYGHVGTGEEPAPPSVGNDADRNAVLRSWLRRLGPSGRHPELRPASGPALLAEATAAVGLDPVSWAVEVGHDLASAITSEIPELGGGEGPFETLRMGTESATLRSMVVLMADDTNTAPITEEALLGDRDFVRRGVPLDKVLRGIRLGHAGMARAFLAGCEALLAPEQRPDQMAYVSERLFAFIDSFSSSMAAEYLAERDRWVTSAAADREEVVRSVLAGDATDPEASSRALAYNLERGHIAVTAWFEPAVGSVNASELQRATAEFLGAMGCTSTLVVPVGRTGLWAWGGMAEPGRGFPHARPEPGRPDIRIACGTPGRGIEGFRLSHEEAALAERVARIGDRPDTRVIHYADVEVVALLTTDLRRARLFVQRELGPLAADTVQAQELRETLRHYLQAERSLITAAAEMHIARNTVTYRVKRAEDLLGHNIADRRFEVHTALTVARMLGSTVLRGDI